MEHNQSTRRGFVAILIASGVAACASQEQAKPSIAPASVTPPVPETSLADKVKLVADTLGLTLPKLGLTNDRLQAGLSIVSQLAELAGKAAGGGSSLANIAQNAVGLISKVAPIAGLVGGPYGMIISAALAMGPAILRLAGIHARQAPGAMSPDQAEVILRHARGF